MKQLYSFLLLGFLSLVAMLCISCSENGAPDKNGKIDPEAIEVLSRQGSVATYKMTEVKMFNKDSQSNGKWEEVDLDGLCGWQTSLPQTLLFQDGKLWRELPLFNISTGPHILYYPWAAYLKVTGQAIDLYIAPKFIYDEVGNTFSIGEYAKFDVIEFNDSKLTLSSETQYSGGRTGEGGKNLEILYYEITDPVVLGDPDAKAFDSDKEAYRYILDCARKQFGRYIDLNEIYYPNIIFDNPIVDLDEVEKILRETDRI